MAIIASLISPEPRIPYGGSEGGGINRTASEPLLGRMIIIIIIIIMTTIVIIITIKAIHVKYTLLLVAATDQIK